MANYLQHTGSGRIYVATPELAERADMRPLAPGADPFKKQRLAAKAPKPEAKVVEVDKAALRDEEAAAEEANVREAYQAMFGRPAPKTMKLETLQARIDSKRQALLAAEDGDAEGDEEDLPSFGGAK